MPSDFGAVGGFRIRGIGDRHLKAKNGQILRSPNLATPLFNSSGLCALETLDAGDRRIVHTANLICGEAWSRDSPRAERYWWCNPPRLGVGRTP